MEKAGIIIRQLRTLAGLTVREAAQKIGHSVGWLSEIENNSGTARISEAEFNRIVTVMDGDQHRAMFKTWVANLKNRERIDTRLDGAVLKFIRRKKKMNLKDAASLVGISVGHLSNLERGVKKISLGMRNHLMTSYGYNPTSFKNLSSDNTRAKVVPTRFKLEILVNQMTEMELADALRFIQK